MHSMSRSLTNGCKCELLPLRQKTNETCEDFSLLMLGRQLNALVASFLKMILQESRSRGTLVLSFVYGPCD
jgi:hypothetical protein